MKSIKSMRIPDGIVRQLKLNGVVLWKQDVLERLGSPLVYIDSDILTITTADDRTEEFVIFVDGVETAVVANLISFTIAGTQYKAEAGMTWGEWVASEYNTGGWVVNNNQIKLITDSYERHVTESSDLLDDAYKVKPSSVIEANHVYGSYKELTDPN